MKLTNTLSIRIRSSRRTKLRINKFFEEFIRLYPHTLEKNRKLRVLYYITAIFLSILVLVVKMALSPVIGTETPFLLLFSAIFVSGWVGGFGPAIVATMITTIGAGYLFFPSYGLFTSSSLIQLTQISIYLGEGLLLSIFLESARISINTTKIKIQQQATITHLGHFALATTDLSKVFKKAVELVAQTLQVNYCKIVELVPDQQVFILRAGIGFKKRSVRNFPVKTGLYSQAGYTVLSEQPVIVSDLGTDARFTDTELLEKYKIVSGVSVAISRDIIPFGVLSVHTTYPREFTQDDIYFLQAIAHIITTAVERKELEKRKDNFIGFASHELKTPMTSLKVFAQFIQQHAEKNNQDPMTITYIKKINTQINKITNLISNLLDITKIQKKKLELHKTTFNINILISEIVENLQPTTQHNLHIYGKIKNKIYADKNRIEQVLINLLSNAIKYSPEKKDIIVSAIEKKSEIIISVKDHGIGIEKQYQNNIFDQFFRINEKTDQTYPGLGIGLYICHDLIKKHRGKIWVESEKGVGTTFSFSLPKH